MRVSVITAIYKDIEALKLIIQALKKQSYKNFELVVAEDNNDIAISNYLNSVTDIKILHTTMIDNGIQKARSQNNAIIESTGEYLIFIDGDCVPYPNFISSHVTLSESGHVLSGRRVNLGSGISKSIRNGSLDSSTISKYYIPFIPRLMLDQATHVGQGIEFSPEGLLYKKYISTRKNTNINILGCNFSCFKKDIINIDGFDESYGESSIPDDTDIQWRFEKSGLKLKSCKMASNMFHLHHDRSHRVKCTPEQVKRMLEKKSSGNYIATIGLSSHSNFTL